MYLREGIHMAIGFFGKGIAPSCEYCEKGRLTRDGKMVMCEHKGIVLISHDCKKFVYSPLRRVPKRRQPASKPEKEDFSL